MNRNSENGMAKIPERDVDSGWAWMVLLASFLTFVLCVGTNFSSGIYFSYIKETFQCGDEVTSWIFAMYSGFSKLLAIFCGYAIRKLGHRSIVMIGSLVSSLGFIVSAFAPDVYVIFFSYGIVAGCGLGFITVPASTIIADYFVKKRDFALPIPLIGISFGMFMFPPLTQWIIDTYGWKQSFLIQSGICLNLLVCGLIMKPKRSHFEDKIVVKTLCCSFKFHCLCWHHFFGQAIVVYFVFANNYYISKGIDASKSPFLLSVFGFCNLLGRIVIVIIGYFKPNPIHYLYIFSLNSLFISLCLGTLVAGQTFLHYAIISGMLGILFGMKNSLQAQTTLILFDQKDFSTISGFILFIFGCISLVGSPLAGIMAENTGIVDAPVIVATSFTGIGFFFSLVLVFISRSHVLKHYLSSKQPIDNTVVQENESMLTRTNPKASIEI